METKKPAQPYAGYHLNGGRQPDAELTQVGPGTPGGEYLRRFWHPIAFSDDVKDLPKRVRILGEDLVLFRDRSGHTGLVHLHCPHRGTSLEFGIPAEHGIRCCYHGWLIDIDGTILETPAEPAESRLKERFCHGAYPVEEYKGLIFAYMGPPDRRPPLPVFDVYDIPGTRLIPGGWIPGRPYHWPVNWVQLKENAMDPVHTCYLHTIASGAQFTAEFGITPELEYRETPIGMVYIATRRVGENVWVRQHDLIMPNIHIVASTAEDGRKEKTFGPPYLINWAVPIDDHNIMEIGWLVESDEMQYDEQTIKQIGFGLLDDRPYEERQRQPGDYDAIVSQGAVAIHAREHLASSDRGVVMFRRMLREGIRAVQSGADPKGVIRGNGEAIQTYTQNAVVRAPAADHPEDDRAVLKGIAQRVFAGDYRLGTKSGADGGRP